MPCGFEEEMRIVLVLALLGVCFQSLLIGALEPDSRNSFIVQIRATPNSEDAYCSTRMSPPEWALGRTVIGFEPLPGAAAHHIMLFTCKNQAAPDEDKRKNHCSSEEGEEYVCGDIQFVWAHGGSSLWLPPNVGLKLGTTKSEVTFALQVHFGMSTTWSDMSGVKLILAEEDDDEPPRKWVPPRVYLLVPNNFPPLQPRKAMELRGSKQVVTASEEMTVFAVRTHAHTRGIWNEVWVTRDKEKVWHYRRSVQLPQSFIPLPNHIKILPGDQMHFQCAYDMSKETSTIWEGPTKRDEMCNVYLMFFVAPKQRLPSSTKPSSSDLHSRLRRMETCSMETFDAVPNNSQVVGVSTDSRTNRIFAFHRGNVIWDGDSYNRGVYARDPVSTDVIMEIDEETGQVLQTMGKGQIYLAHSIKVDPHQDNIIWLVDVGSHQIHEYNTKTKQIVRSLGKKHLKGSSPDRLCQPTDIAFSANKEFIYVSDGYCNARVIVFRRSDLAYVKQFGTQGEGRGQFNLPHSINTVKCGSQELLLVSDRENGRIQILDVATGEFLKSIQSWEIKYLAFSSIADPSTHRLFVGLMSREGDSNFGAVWTSDHSVCDMIHASEPAAVSGRVVCTYENAQVKEPHMLSILGRRLFIAEAVDGTFTGRLTAVRF